MRRVELNSFTELKVMLNVNEVNANLKVLEIVLTASQPHVKTEAEKLTFASLTGVGIGLLMTKVDSLAIVAYDLAIKQLYTRCMTPEQRNELENIIETAEKEANYPTPAERAVQLFKWIRRAYYTSNEKNAEMTQAIKILKGVSLGLEAGLGNSGRFDKAVSYGSQIAAMLPSRGQEFIKDQMARYDAKYVVSQPEEESGEQDESDERTEPEGDLDPVDADFVARPTDD